MAHLGGSRRIESGEVKTGSVVVDQFPVAEETTLSPNFQFIDFKSQAGEELHPVLEYHFNVESCRTDVKDLDQLIIRRGHRITQLLRNDPTRKEAKHLWYLLPHIVRNVQWSPLGSYLLAMDKDIVFICGGDSFGFMPLLMRYSQPMVERVDFSPGEKYLVTYGRSEPSNPKELWLKIFDVRTGSVMIGLDGHVVDVLIRWAGGKDDKYFATLSKNTVSVYETKTFRVLGNKPVSVDDVVDMSWSPTDSILALLKGGGKQPTKVVLVKIPSKVELMQKDIHSVNDCKMYWQSNGKYLAVKVNRNTYSLFCFKEEGITTEDLEVDEEIIAFAWEPSGHRFAVIHIDQLKRNVSFYSMETSQNPGKVSKLAIVDNKQAGALFWSPRGKHIVLVDCDHLEFFDVDKLETMNTAEHPMATVIAWDPTGRYVATAVTISQEINETGKIDDGFKMWSFNGELLYFVPTEDYRLLQLEWRPYGGIIDDEMFKNLEKTLEESEEEFENSASEEEY